jgi:glucoamylase
MSSKLRLATCVASLFALCAVQPALAAGALAPGAPGQVSTWSYAGKTGIGTSYDPYVKGQHSGTSKVWFSVADGMLTETMYGLIHEAQIRSVRLAVKTSAGLVVEGENTTSRTEYLHTDAQGRPLSPAFRLITRDKAGTVEIEKRIFTDPSRNTLLMRVTVRALKGPVTPYLLVEPHMANTSVNDEGEATPSSLSAHEGKTWLSVLASRPFAQASVGYLGASDGLTRLKVGGKLGHVYGATDKPGSILLTGQLATVSKGSASLDLAFGFGDSATASAAAAKATLTEGYGPVLAHFNGDKGQTGWSSYLSSLTQLPRLAAQSNDGGKLAYASAIALKVHEDKTYAGAVIASLSNPWGDSVKAGYSTTGYKAVWPRDFYECAMAFAALGDKETPVAAFRYLRTVQVKPTTPGASGATGWFQQKSHVDGQAEWKGVQLDQTAMPIMLGWKLWKQGLISQDELRTQYAQMLKPAADFLVTGGEVTLLDNHFTVRPLYTQQERWEEQEGYSPSTSAAVITGLQVASEIAQEAGDAEGATRYAQTAERFSGMVEQHMFTTTGPLGNGRYFLRTATGESPDQGGETASRNGLPAINSASMVDAGFLEFVRYGVRRADDPHILDSLKVLDDETRSDDLRVRYSFHFKGDARTYPGFRRYGHDGYGEDAVTGHNYFDGGVNSPGQRGRVWPLLTGERGHYQLALAGLSGKPDPAAVAEVRATYVRAMERFANEGLMLPEQVYDGVGAPAPRNAPAGQGTNSATPLAWAHAEYIKLLRSLADGQVWDLYQPVQSRFAK